MERNGCPVAMETVEHRNFVVKMFQILWPKSIFGKKREFSLKTQFGQSLQIDVSVIILAGKKIEKNSFFNEIEFFAGKSKEEGFSRAVQEESVKARKKVRKRKRGNWHRMRKVALFISLVLDDDRATRGGLLFARFGCLGQTGLHLGIAQIL